MRDVFYDRRMADGSQHRTLAQEPLGQLAAPHDLERHESPGVMIARLVDASHAAGCNFLQNLKAAGDKLRRLHGVAYFTTASDPRGGPLLRWPCRSVIADCRGALQLH